MITETWLIPSVYDSELFGNNFTVYRCDRSLMNSTKMDGGGVLIANKSGLKSERVTIQGIESLEMVVIKTSMESVSHLVCCLYIPSASNVEAYAAYGEAVDHLIEYSERNQCERLFIAGDFNLPSVGWIVDDENPSVRLPINVSSGYTEKILDALFSGGLYQLNSVFDNLGVLLDLAFYSDNDDVVVLRCGSPMVPIDPVYPPIEIFIYLSMIGDFVETKDDSYQQYNFRSGNYIGLSDYFRNCVDWNFLVQFHALSENFH